MIINEDNLLEQLQKRNEDALYFLIDTYGGLIKSIVMRHLYHLQPIQEECIDDILLAIWDNIGSFCPEKNSFKNWIAAIAKYKSIDYKRKHLKVLDQENIDCLVLTNSENVEKTALEQDLSQEIESLLSNLNADDRKIFIQYYLEDQDVKAIAEKMQLKKSNIYNRLSRGRTRLRKIYESWQF